MNRSKNGSGRSCNPILLASCCLIAPMICRASELRNVVLDWNALIIDAIRADNTGPTLSTRNLAILHTAIYDAVNSLERSHQPYQFLVDPPTGAFAEGAAVSAAYEVIKTLYPPISARADELYNTYVAEAPKNAALTNSLIFGTGIARLTLDSRSSDGSTTTIPYIPSDLPGRWRRTPPFFRPPLDPQWRDVTLFCLPDVDPYVPGPPPALDSVEYAEAFNEVKAIGSKTSTVRTAEQSQIAVFWSDFSYTAMPPGHWHEITAQIVQNKNLNLEETARLFALISLAQADSAIVCWEAKFRYNFWRPVTAIQRADEDENPATTADPNWQQYLNAPPFPSYTSGHSTFSKASSVILARYFGTDALSFSASSDSLPGIFRTFTSLSACADEVGMSRIYGGFHFQFDNREGKICGQKIAEYISGNFLLSNDKLPSIHLENIIDGTPVLHLHGHVGSTFVLETTGDFKQWLPISTNIAEPGGVIFMDSAGSAERRFYRIKE